MTTYHTGNPVPSTAVKDLYDNAENLDQALNNRTSDKWTDRLGHERMTWEGMTRLSNLGAAVEAAERAEEAADRAASYDNLLVYLSYDSPSDKRMVDDTSQPVGTLGRVTNDDGPDKNGDYVMTASGWEWSDVQPANAAEVQEVKSEVSNLVELITTSPNESGFAVVDPMGFAGMAVTPKSLWSGAGGLVAVDDVVNLINSGGVPFASYISSTAYGDWAEVVIDAMGFVGAGLRADGQWVFNGSSPDPEPENDTLPYANLSLLRNTRMSINRLVWKRGVAAGRTQLSMGLIGDSFTVEQRRWCTAFAERLIEQYGDAGGGWIGFTFDVGKSHGNVRTVEGGVDPILGTHGPDSVFSVSRVGSDGRWERWYRSGTGPDIGTIYSSTPGATVTISANPDKAIPRTGAAAPDTTRVDLHYLAEQACTLRYRYNQTGDWTEITLSSSGGSQVFDLGAPPSGTWRMDIELVSGTANLYGAYLYSDVNGVVVSKLAVSGSSAVDWASVSEAEWVQAFANVPLNVVHILLGANDQNQHRTVEEMVSGMTELVRRIRVAHPTIDIIVTMPYETYTEHAPLFPMDNYTAAIRSFCESNNVAFLNLQPYFGMQMDYGPDGAFPLLEDLLHPASTTGGQIISDTVQRAISYSN